MAGADREVRRGLEMFGSPVQDAGVHRAEDLARGSKLGRKERDQMPGNRKATGRKNENEGRPKHQRESSRNIIPKGEMTSH